MFAHLLAAYDGSDVSERAFRVAVELARAFGGRVRLLAVVEMPASAFDVPPAATEDECIRLEAELDALVRAVPQGWCPIECEVAYGIPTAVLLDRAARHGVDHLVLGRTGKGAMRRLLLGSVSRDVVALSKIGVTLVA